MQAGSQNASVSSLRSNNPPAETQLKFLLDQEKMGAMGLDIASVNSMLSIIFAGRDVNDFTLNGELKPVYVQGDAPYRMQETAINDWHARNANGEMVPFSSFIRTQWISGAPTLSRFNGVGAISMEGAAGGGGRRGAGHYHHRRG